jgi:hypothetical protein
MREKSATSTPERGPLTGLPSTLSLALLTLQILGTLVVFMPP